MDTLRDRAWCERGESGGWVVYFAVVCPDGDYYTRSWDVPTFEKAAQRVENLKRLGDYRTQRFGHPPIEATMPAEGEGA